LEATRAFAARLAALLRPGDVVALEGDLGAGKTELTRAVVRARAKAELEVPSPTFTLLQAYELPGLTITHADLYRLADPDELAELGLEEAWRTGAVLVEWPERAGERLPGQRLTLRLEGPLPGRPAEYRELVIEGTPDWRARLAEAGL
jgi:tRNA threonylcarbamoyl adenosine modification protein YjeE